MKILTAIVCLLLAGCTGCSPLKYTKKGWDPMGDSVAAETQRLMRGTVQVDHLVVALVPDLKEQKLTPMRGGSTGSGVVIAARGKESLVLTAAHVCKPKETVTVNLSEEVSVEVPVIGEEFMVWTMDLEKLAAIPMEIDEDNDVCVMKVFGKAGNVIEVASSDPPLGAIVTHVGSPRGVLNLHRAFVTDGHYMGVQHYRGSDRHSEMIAIPVDHGSSGGGVFYRGKVFAVVSRVDENWKQIAICEGDDAMRTVIRKAKEKWIR
jgi:S1-C subfamily serine protease